MNTELNFDRGSVADSDSQRASVAYSDKVAPLVEDNKQGMDIRMEDSEYSKVQEFRDPLLESQKQGEEIQELDGEPMPRGSITSDGAIQGQNLIGVDQIKQNQQNADQQVAQNDVSKQQRSIPTMNSQIIYASKDASRLTNTTQNYYVFEKSFKWNCVYVVPFLLFAGMMSMIVLQFYYAFLDVEEGEANWRSIAEMFSVFAGMFIIAFGSAVVMWPKSTTVLIDKQHDRIVIQHHHLFRKEWDAAGTVSQITEIVAASRGCASCFGYTVYIYFRDQRPVIFQLNGSNKRQYIDEIAKYCTGSPASYEPFACCGKGMKCIVPPYGRNCIPFLLLLGVAYAAISLLVITDDETGA